MNVDLFGNVVPPMLKSGKNRKPKTNPLIKVYGAGPVDTKCIDCRFQYFKHFAKKYSKCELRTNGPHNGASTDHNSRYDSCGQFEAKPEEKRAIKMCHKNLKVGTVIYSRNGLHPLTITHFFKGVDRVKYYNLTDAKGVKDNNDYTLNGLKSLFFI